MSKLSDTLMRPAIAGGVAAIASYTLFDGSSQVLIMDYPVSGFVLIGVTVAASEFVGAIAGNYILPMIESPDNAYLTRQLTQPLLTGATTNLALYLMDKADLPNFQSILLGAGSSLAAGYVHETFYKKGY